MMFSAFLRSISSRRIMPKGVAAGVPSYYHTWSSTIRNITPSSSFQQLPSSQSSPFKNISERGLAGKALLKTNKSAAKRFRVRGNDRIKRNKAGRSHNTGHKGRKRINQLAASAPIKGKGIEDRMRRLIRA
jgi:ribosomal protein L35